MLSIAGEKKNLKIVKDITLRELIDSVNKELDDFYKNPDNKDGYIFVSTIKYMVERIAWIKTHITDSHFNMDFYGIGLKIRIRKEKNIYNSAYVIDRITINKGFENTLAIKLYDIINEYCHNELIEEEIRKKEQVALYQEGK